MNTLIRANSVIIKNFNINLIMLNALIKNKTKVLHIFRFFLWNFGIRLTTYGDNDRSITYTFFFFFFDIAFNDKDSGSDK